MRDHVTKERISAYVDGELEGDELRLVEDLLADSAEYRQLASELQELRASMQSLPSFKLPADFAANVVKQIDDQEVTPSNEPVRTNRNKPKARPWRSILAGVASIAAMITVAMMLRPSVPTVDPHLPSGGGPDVTLATLPVYLKEEPQQLVMVHDFTVTKVGQRNDVVSKLLRKHGINVTPAMRLDASLEDELVALDATRGLELQEKLVPFKAPNDPKAVKQRAELIYVAGMSLTLGQLSEELYLISLTGGELRHGQFAAVIEPREVGVIKRLHGSASEYYAASKTLAPSEFGQAFRISFRLDLASIGVPGVATFPTPVLQTQTTASPVRANSPVSSASRDGLDLSQLSVPISPRGVVIEPGGEVQIVDSRAPIEEELLPDHMLLILRYDES